MKMSTRGRYALVVMIDLAKNYNTGEYLSLKEISEKENISLKYLEKIMMLLNKAKFLDVSRGNNGGYRLIKEPKEYKVGDILRLTEGSLSPVACLADDAKECQMRAECRTIHMWEEFYKLEHDFFYSKKLSDLCK